MRGSFIHIAMFAVVVMVLSISPLSAQQLPERKLVRQGNEQFERRNFNNSLNRYNEALEHAPHSYEAQYNRANAYLQNMLANPQDSTFTDVTSNRYFEQIANNKSLTAEQRGEVLRNLGESLFLQEEYEAALNAFRESLKLSPEDKETKRNYVLTKRIVDQKRNQQQQNNQQQQQQNDQQNDQNNNDQNDNQQQQQDNKQQGDQNNDQQQDKGNDNENKPEEQPENGDEPKQDDQQKNGEQPNKEGATPEQERMLDVIQGEEDKTQDKIKDAKQGAVVFGKKNW
ncbi:MAG: tetratricopeptide repeat protein [Alistipes sp.]|nr:tetratricopeptide repeat protein [Alistipes sp.]